MAKLIKDEEALEANSEVIIEKENIGTMVDTKVETKVNTIVNTIVDTKDNTEVPTSSRLEYCEGIPYVNENNKLCPGCGYKFDWSEKLDIEILDVEESKSFLLSSHAGNGHYSGKKYLIDFHSVGHEGVREDQLAAVLIERTKAKLATSHDIRKKGLSAQISLLEKYMDSLYV